jgi:hypothetical protein
MKKNLFILTAAAFLTGCNFSKSVKIDLISGLTTSGNNISCEKVFISSENKEISRSTFTYGETFYLNFDDVKGLKLEDGKVFPVMELYILSAAGDTIMAADDLYSQYSEGIDASPLQLNANVTVAKPIHSAAGYKLVVKITDRKDEGTFTAVFNFDVIANQLIKVNAEGAGYSEVYLFTRTTGSVITDNRVKMNDETYLIFEGISGFTETDGKVFPGLSLEAFDANGAQVLDYKDLFSDYTEPGVEAGDFTNQVSSNFVFHSSEIISPVKVRVTIWDKKGTARITAETSLDLVNQTN